MPFYNTINNKSGFSVFLDPRQHLLLPVLFSHISACQVASHYGFDMHFPNSMMLNFFSCVYQLFVYLLWRTIHSDSWPIFKLGFLSFYCWLVSVLCVFWIQVPYIWLANIFSHSFFFLIFSYSMDCAFHFVFFSKILPRREEEREGEKHQCVVASHVPPTGDLACNPGMCPDWESNQWSFALQSCTQSTEPHQMGPFHFLYGVLWSTDF